MGKLLSTLLSSRRSAGGLRGGGGLELGNSDGVVASTVKEDLKSSWLNLSIRAETNSKHDQGTITGPVSGRQAVFNFPESSSSESFPPGGDSTHQTMTWQQKQEKGEVISKVLREFYVTLTEVVDPGKASSHLYQSGIFDEDESESAARQAVPRKQRSEELVRLLIRKVRSHPDWFPKACVALDKAGAQSVVQEIRAQVSERFKKLDHQSSVNSSITSLSTANKVAVSNNGGSKTLLSPLDVSSNAESTEGLNGQNESMNRKYRSHARDSLSSLDYESGDQSLLSLVHSIPKSSDTASSHAKRQEGISKLKIRLLETGETCRTQDKGGNTILHVAVSKEDADVASMILKYAPYIANVPNKRGETALHLSTKKHFTHLTASLCASKVCDPYVFDENGKTPLHYACASGITDLVKPLLKSCNIPPFVNALDNRGDTGLHIAARGGFVDIMKQLHKKKADPRTRNKKHQTPIDVGIQSNNDKVIKEMKKWKGFSHHDRDRRLSSSSSVHSINSQTATLSSAACSELVIPEEVSGDADLTELQSTCADGKEDDN